MVHRVAVIYPGQTKLVKSGDRYAVQGVLSHAIYREETAAVVRTLLDALWTHPSGMYLSLRRSDLSIGTAMPNDYLTP